MLNEHMAAMDNISKLRLVVLASAVALSVLATTLAAHGIFAGFLDEIGGGFPT